MRPLRHSRIAAWYIKNYRINTVLINKLAYHLCFSGASLEDVLNELKKAGIVYEDWAGKKASITLRVDGVHQIYFQDPDGYWIEINDDRY